jgi:hypothetical protein
MTKFIFFICLAIPVLLRSQCALCEEQVDLIENGDFSSGNTGFASNMQYVTGIFTCPLCPENTYTIGTNAVFHHSGFAGTDHTNPPSGSFFIANGMGALGSEVWCQTHNVQPQTDYTFVFWTRDVTNNANPHPMAHLYASFNGAWSTDSIVASGGWNSFTTVWNSGTATALEVCIVNNQWQTGGNDFGLDDISLTACEPIQLAQPAFAGTDVSICSNETILLGQPSAVNYDYTWTPVIGIDNPASAQPSFQWTNDSYEDITMEIIVVRDSANVGCIESDTVLIQVRHMPNYVTLQDTVVCPNETATFTIPSPWYNVLWNGVVVSPTIEVSGGEHSVAIEFNGCILNDTVLVLEEVFPTVDLSAVHEACAPDGVLLELDVPVWWSDGSYSPVWLTYESAQVDWYYEQNGCVFYDTAQVIIHPKPIWLLGTDTVSCDGETLSLDPQWPGDWNVPGTQNVLQTNADGDYVFTAASGSCDYYFPLTIALRATPALPEDALVDLCAGASMLIGLEPAANDTYYWQNDSTGSWLEINEAGNYQLTAQNFCGADSMRFEVLELVCSSDLFIPNAFTPNEDAINEAWRPLGHDITRYHLIIYDALGNAIFETRDWSKAWTPGTGRIDLPYTYRIEYYDYQGVEHLRVGHINVLR